ncbi:wax ester/triacylglycerol synthase domain-containing protein [Mycobacterium senriense]|uniref:diacylglycerol O-acyltransferase n=1 Tax=Mycobacterium senriense TaxID=2775496 RepID=A0ABN6IFJ5_9MYCO|nr:wax ester/triacylglycerol synthase domain-containing protein [Mycobacterium senriense]BCZ22570.1 diacylglycerol O-acyltransferase [Mycobacterium senriense]
MVARLLGIDALSLHTQSSKMPAHTVTLVIIDAPDRFSHHRLHQLVVASLPQMARFRSRLVDKPLGLGQPLWAEIEDYDASPQIHCATVRAPGGRRELADLIGDLSTARHDSRDRLWEAWSIDGLAGGRWALAVKTSPVLNDGAAGMASLWPRLLTTLPHADATNNLPAEPSLGSAPSAGDVVTDVVSEIAENHVTGLWLAAQTMSGVLRALRDRLSGTAGRDSMAPTASPMSGPVPHTAFNAPPTERRAVAFASIRLADVKTVSDAFGGSIPNVVLAACTLSLRAWLQQHDKVPDDPLLMRMPFELPATDPPHIGKSLTVGRLRIPVHLDDPVQVLANLHTATERLNAIRGGSNQKGCPTVDVATLASLMPPSVARVGTQLYTRSGLRHRFEPICHGSVSYIANGPVPAYCAGAKVVGMHSVAPLAEGGGLNVALTSHGEKLDVSVCACPDSVPGVDDIATGIARSVDVLLSAAKESPRGQGRSVVSEMTTHPANRPRGRSYDTFR